MESSKLLKLLKDYGADVNGAMSRFLDDAGLYETCINMFIDDENFGMLGQALHEKRYQDAFNSAHTLKGVAANLGLEPLLALIVAIVEPLRHGQYDADLSAKYREILAGREALQALLA